MPNDPRKPQRFEIRPWADPSTPEFLSAESIRAQAQALADRIDAEALKAAMADLWDDLEAEDEPTIH